VTVAIVTDSASDLDAERAGAAGVTVVPLLVRFADEEFRSGTELSTEAFYGRLLAPGAPFPGTAACAPGDFTEAYRVALDRGAEGVVCLTVGSRLSATHAAAVAARDALPSADIRVVDTATVTLAQGLLVLLAAEAAAAGESATSIVRLLEARRDGARLVVMLDTLEYLRRGGRISATRAAIGSFLSVKPIITIQDGVVETLDRPRTVSRARERLLELASTAPVERLAVVHSGAPEVDRFRTELAERLGLHPDDVISSLIGPTVASHAGPGAFGAAMLLESP
jgi:DegV family protein with EDD domain